jgi:hypothetical protein
MKEIIPNIYKKAICSGNIITLENDISNELNIDDNRCGSKYCPICQEEGGSAN